MKEIAINDIVMWNPGNHTIYGLVLDASDTCIIRAIKVKILARDCNTECRFQIYHKNLGTEEKFISESMLSTCNDSQRIHVLESLLNV